MQPTDLFLLRLTRYFALPLALIACACGSSSTSPTTTTSGPTSSLNISLKDSPFADAKAVLVTFSVVSAHLSGADFITLPFAGGASSRTCDLKKLVTAQDVLGVGPLPVGHYTQLRLVVSGASIYFDSATSGSACASTISPPAGSSAAVDIPSGELKLNREFDLTSTTSTNILLDFDGDQSIKATGNGKYTMTPVIAVVSVSSASSGR